MLQDKLLSCYSSKVEAYEKAEMMSHKRVPCRHFQSWPNII